MDNGGFFNFLVHHNNNKSSSVHKYLGFFYDMAQRKQQWLVNEVIPVSCPTTGFPTLGYSPTRLRPAILAVSRRIQWIRVPRPWHRWVLNKGWLPWKLSYLILFLSPWQTKDLGVIIPFIRWREEPWSQPVLAVPWASSGASLHFAISQVIPFAVCTGLSTSLLSLLAACHLALSLLISTSTTAEQRKSKRVSLSE